MKRNILVLVLLVIGCVVFQGCSSKKSDSLGEGEELSEADLNAQRDGRFGEGGIPTAEGEGLFQDIPFDYDSSVVDSRGRAAIEENVRTLKQFPEMRIQLEGHCDERGTAEYNLALGAERARAVKEILVSLGVSGSRLDTVSYGEEVPLDPGHAEQAWAVNRRVHFSGFRDLPRR